LSLFSVYCPLFMRSITGYVTSENRKISSKTTLKTSWIKNFLRKI